MIEVEEVPDINFVTFTNSLAGYSVTVTDTVDLSSITIEVAPATEVSIVI